ncbi:hypothetical protein I4U23_004579 [Adineta vaga]|nr:hypothetical protein I4U23_004579 [Adineta vaga]
MFLFVCSLLLLSTSSLLTLEIKHPSYMTYVLIRDYFNGFKAPEYSVYNKTEKDLYYRIESNYDFQDNMKLVSYPSKKSIAKLRSKTRGTSYEAKISIRNTTSNQWIDGKIIQHPQWLSTNYSIEWNGYHLSIINNFIASWTLDIIDSSRNELLAQSQRRWFSWKFKYQLDLYSDQVPESIYLLGLAVVSRGKNG